MPLPAFIFLKDGNLIIVLNMSHVTYLKDEKERERVLFEADEFDNLFQDFEGWKTKTTIVARCYNENKFFTMIEKLYR